MKNTPENLVKYEIKQALDMVGAFHVPLMQGLGSHKGLPDRVAIKDGKVYMLEVKTLNGKMSKYQLEFNGHWTTNGGNYHVVRSAEDIFRLFGRQDLLKLTGNA